MMIFNYRILIYTMYISKHSTPALQSLLENLMGGCGEPLGWPALLSANLRGIWGVHSEFGDAVMRS